MSRKDGETDRQPSTADSNVYSGAGGRHRRHRRNSTRHARHPQLVNPFRAIYACECVEKPSSVAKVVAHFAVIRAVRWPVSRTIVVKIPG